MTRGLTANAAWLSVLRDCYLAPHHTPTPRGHHNRERLANLLLVDMGQPVVTLAARRLGYRFLCAEAAWILSGDDRVEPIAPYSKTVHYYSDDGSVFFGAYGPKILAQLPYVLRALRGDRDSRQAVINIWRESPPVTRDPPCTLNCHFLVRDDQLHLFVNMRSSDVWLGVPYDIFNFSMLAGYVLLELGDTRLRLGTLYQYAASRHLYERDWERADTLLRDDREGVTHVPKVFDPLVQFASAADLVAHLWALARRDETGLRSTWLNELLSLNNANR